jgi:hypothetical protein
MKTANHWVLTLTFVAAQFAFAPLALGQNVGDLVVVERPTQLKLAEESVATLTPGYAALVEKIQGDWLWISRPAAGWVPRRDVAPVQVDRTFRSREGFKVNYPQHWLVASNEPGQETSGVAVNITDPFASDFTENLNVVVSDWTAPASEETARQAADAVTQQFAVIGIDAAVSHVAVIDVGGRKAIAMELEVLFPMQPEPNHQWTVVVPADARSFVITATARAADFEWYRPIFERMVSSFRITPP